MRITYLLKTALGSHLYMLVECQFLWSILMFTLNTVGNCQFINGDSMLDQYKNIDQGIRGTMQFEKVSKILKTLREEEKKFFFHC